MEKEIFCFYQLDTWKKAHFTYYLLHITYY